MIRIDVYQHGDDDLWLSLGPFFCDRAVHKEVGGPIYSTVGTTWLVAHDTTDRVIGFASLRNDAKAVWLDYAYVVPAARGRGVFSRLSTERERLAKAFNLPLRTVVPKARWKHYRDRGWRLVSTLGMGSWIRAIKETA